MKAASCRPPFRFGRSALRPPLAPKLGFVASLYRELLGREPEPGALERWAPRLDGLSCEEIYFSFVECEEYRRRKADGVPLAVPPGHFYSPIVDPREIRERADAVFARDAPPPGVALREAEQLALLQRMAAEYPRLPFADHRQDGLRFFYDNPAFGHGDAIALACMILLQRPGTIIEVGSGYSSALSLDIVESRLEWQTRCVFVEPHTELLLSLLKRYDAGKIEIIPRPVQEVDLALYDRLQPGDILFIDSTHIVKTGSDVVHHLTRVLPRLRPGVLIHFHDVFYPFEYPEDWVLQENRSWNEVYYLHALLMHSDRYEIVLFNDFMARAHPEQLSAALPLAMRNPGGSLWLRKLRR